MAVRFDASADVLYRTASLPSLATFTWMGWLRIVTDRDAASDCYVTADSSGNYLTLQLGDDGTSLRVISPNGSTVGTNLTTGTWYHVALTKSGSSIIVYLNGVSDITRTDTISFTPTAFLMGANGQGSFLNGRLAGVKIWSGTALTQAEVQAEMAVLRPVKTANLYGWYPMFPGATERVRDYSGNGRPLTAGGTLTDEDPPPVSWGRGILYINNPAVVTDASVTGLPAAAQVGAGAGIAGAGAIIAGLAAAMRAGAAAGGVLASVSITGLPAGTRVGIAAGVISSGAALTGLLASANAGAAGASVSTGASVSVTGLPASARLGNALGILSIGCAITAAVAAIRLGTAAASVSTGASVVVICLPASITTGTATGSISSGGNVAGYPAFARSGTGIGASSGGAEIAALSASVRIGTATAGARADILIAALIAWARLAVGTGRVTVVVPSVTPPERITRIGARSRIAVTEEAGRVAAIQPEARVARIARDDD